MKVFKVFLADILFFCGHTLVTLSARLMSYKDTVEELKQTKAHWLKKDAFRSPR
jgi:hypothetical protein